MSLFNFFGHGIWACGILDPQPGIEPTPPAVEARSLNYGATREVREPGIFDADNKTDENSADSQHPFLFGQLTPKRTHLNPLLPPPHLAPGAESPQTTSKQQACVPTCSRPLRASLMAQW